MRTTSTCVDAGAVWVALTDCLSTVAVQALASTATARTYTVRMSLLPVRAKRRSEVAQAACSTKPCRRKGGLRTSSSGRRGLGTEPRLRRDGGFLHLREPRQGVGRDRHPATSASTARRVPSCVTTPKP